MTTVNHTWTLTIDGTDRSSLLSHDSLQARLSMQNGASVADFVMDDIGTYTPAAWDEVAIKVNGATIFGGYIANRTAETIGVSSTARARWSVACRDWTMLFDKVIVNATYTGLTDAAIAQNLINTYLAGDGFTVTDTQITRYNLTYGFENLTLRDALNKLADEVEATWYVDAAKNVYWFNRYSPPQAAFSIDTSGTLAGYYAPRYGTLKRTIDDSSIFNRITVYGRNVQGDRVNETFVTNASGTENTFELDNFPHSIIRVEATFTNGREVLMGSAIGYEPDNILYDTSGDAARMKWVLCNREKRTVKINTPIGKPLAVTSVAITYYKVRQVAVTVDDTGLQATHGRVLEAQIYNQNIANDADAATYGEALIQAWGYGKETVTFDVTEYGLLPGTRLIVYSPEANISPTIDYILKQDGDNLLLEDSTSAFEKETNNNVSGVYMVQSVVYRGIHTPSGYMIYASVQAGAYEQSIIDILAKLTGGAGVGSLPSVYMPGKLSDAASDLGEVVAGRAIFTDGGTAAFGWTDYAEHTGVVIGLNDSGTPPVGQLSILDTGVTKLKLGNLDGMGSVGTVAPSGWGIWTDNGYFQGVVAASSIVGNSIDGGTITGALVQSGTVRTSTAAVNSSNPGVTMSSAGLFGYGTAGLTFALYSDPALKPYFSSGTITNVVYEVTTASVIRTGTANPKIQIDNSGIFAYAPGTATTPTFSVDVASGVMTATGGNFSGAITATSFTGGTVTGGTIRTSASHPRIQMGTAVLNATDSGGTVKFSVSATTGLMTATGGSFSGSVSASTISGGTISGGYISGGTVAGGIVSGGTISGGYISGGTVNGAIISGGTILSGNTFGTGDTYFTAGTTATSGGRLYWRVGTANVVSVAGYNVNGWSGFDITGQNANAGTVTFNGLDFTVKDAVFHLDVFSIDASTGGIKNNLIPDATANNRTLGDSSREWYAIYMKDAFNGNPRVLTIYNGVVTVS